MSLLRTLARSAHCGAVVVSHDDRLRAIADRIVWLEDGIVTRIENPEPVAGEVVVGPARGRLCRSAEAAL